MLSWVIKNINYLNSSKFFSGLVMLMLNIGSKYITIELSNTQSEYLRSTLARQMLIFSISWMGSRDIFKALALTAIFNVLTEHLFNEESTYCIVPMHWRIPMKKVLDKNKDSKVSEEEIHNALKVLAKARTDEQQKEYLRLAEGFCGIR